jgi:hypothetical protein
LILIPDLRGRGRISSLLRRVRHESFESRDFCFGRCEIAHVRRHFFGREVAAGFLGVKHRVSESLREAVDGLPSAKQVEADAAFIERALGSLSRAIQFLTEPVE